VSDDRLFDRSTMEELDNRLGIEQQAKGHTEPWDHTKDHAIAKALADAALQFSLVLANMTATDCECGIVPCPTIVKARNLLTGILIPSVVVQADEHEEDLSYGDLIEMAEKMASKLHAHARASIGRPL
jgi:hypothetical protein